MLAVGRALARKPRLLLLDELSLGLAPVIVETLLPVVREYAQSTGCAVLLGRAARAARARGRRPRVRALARRDRPPRQREVLRADRQLLIASYLGEQQVPVGEASAVRREGECRVMSVATVASSRS